jgi:hypothetical protein
VSAGGEVFIGITRRAKGSWSACIRSFPFRCPPSNHADTSKHHGTEAYDQARDTYTEAISVDAICVEAMYNLALVFKRLKQLPQALEWFEKLHAMLKNNPEVIYHIMDM